MACTLSNSGIQQVTSDILAAIATMHEAGHRHGDIKTKNIVRHGQRFKLIDFDLSAELGTPPSMIDDSKLLGSSAYLPPELIMHATQQHWLVCGIPCPGGAMLWFCMFAC